MKPDKSVHGGKAAALLELYNAGFNVPEFCCVPGDVDLSDDLVKTYINLMGDNVAVRSSSTIEDGKNASCAGQHDTFLNVAREDIIDKMRLVRESLNSERAQEYKKQHNVEDGSMAVIIQKMVNADKSGVSFSTHPVTKDNNTLIIEAVEGLGEDLVSGKVQPTLYEIKRDDLSVFKITHGNVELSPKEVSGLTKLVMDIEEHFGWPVDVEWAIEGDELFVLQARPITALE